MRGDLRGREQLWHAVSMLDGLAHPHPRFWHFLPRGKKGRSPELKVNTLALRVSLRWGPERGFAWQRTHLGDVLAAAHGNIHAEAVADAFGALDEERGDVGRA